MNNKDITLDTFEPYISVLHNGFKSQGAKEHIFTLTASCKARGNSGFQLVESDKESAPKHTFHVDESAPKHTCHVDMDKLYRDPAQRQQKCDSVFFILNDDISTSDAKKYSAIDHLRYCCFGELKDSRNETYQNMIKQIKATIELFRQKFQAAGLPPKALPNEKIIGVLCGGSPGASTNFQDIMQKTLKSDKFLIVRPEKGVVVLR